MFIATHIHNQSLGNTYLYNTIQEAQEKCKEIATSILDRDLDEGETNDIEDIGELYIFNDHDNQYTISVGVIENCYGLIEK